MDQPSTRDPEAAGRLAAPPADSGIDVEATDHGVRITLPRLYSRADVVTVALSAAVAVWMAVWLDAMRADPTASVLGMGVMAAVGLIFGAVAVTQGYELATRPVIEEHGDALVCRRQLGVRRFSRREIPKAAVTAVDRGRAIGEGPQNPAAVRIWTDDGVHRVGKHLDAEGLKWLEGAVSALTD